MSHIKKKITLPIVLLLSFNTFDEFTIIQKYVNHINKKICCVICIMQVL